MILRVTRLRKTGFNLLALLIGVSISVAGPETVLSQGLTVTNYPYHLIDLNETIQINWVEQINASLYFGTEQDKYDRKTTASGTKSLQFSPVNEGFSPGVYYCRVSNGVLHSLPFTLYIESSQAPISRSPQSGAVISSISPKFEWDAVPGVPFYHLILTDQPVKITRDAQGGLQIEGANIIYQAITSQTEMTYGQPDPSGFFTHVNGIAPPLLSGKTYNWIVLNNYGNNPALSSIVQTGVQSFTVNLVVNLSAPVLTSPASNIQTGSLDIEFSWQRVNGAKNYLFELFEIIKEDGSSSTFPVWQVATTGTSVLVPARKILKNSYYEWHVIALDESGKGKVSEKRNFTYAVPMGEISISSRSSFGQMLPRVTVQVQPVVGNGENNDYLTSDSGILNLNVQPGIYRITGKKNGFRDTTVTIEAEVNRSTPLVLQLKNLRSAVSGEVKSTTNQAIANPQVTAVDMFSKKRVQTTGDALGRFRLPLPVSIFELFASLPGYSGIDTVLVDLTGQPETRLSSPLHLRKNTGTLIGKVISQNSIPLFGAQVIATNSTSSFRTVSDANGGFQFLLSPGTWNLRAEKPGFSQKNDRTVQILENQTVNLNPELILHTDAAMLNGIITDGTSGVGYVQILAVPSQGASYQSYSNAKGNFNVSVPAGVYDFSYHKAGYVDPLPQRVILSPGQSINNLTVVLQTAPIEVSGIVSSNGGPVAGAVVTNNTLYDTSRVNGYYRLWLPAGDHRLFVTKAGFFLSEPVQLSLKPGDQVIKQDIRLQPQAAVVKGKIFSSGLPVAAATVTINNGSGGFETRSDQNGDYIFTIAPGVWTITARKNGFQDQSIQGIAVQAGQIIQGIEFNLSPLFGTVRGTVRDDKGGIIPLALVKCPAHNKQALVDNSGKYQLQLSPGAVSLTAQKDGFGEQTKSITITANQTQTVDFTLSTFGTLTGKITEINGTPIIQAEVLAVQGSDTLKDFTDYTGEFRLYLSGGTYLFKADKLGYAAANQQITIKNGETVTRNLQLQTRPEELARISGNITLDRKTPLENSLVKISGRQNRNAQTNNSGNFEFEKLEAGFNYILIPSLRNHFFIPASITYQPLNSNKTEQNFVASLYGDLSANQEVSSFDGSLILRLSARKDISPHFSTFPRDSLAADVSGNKKISAFDASLIFRFAVGLISVFPAEANSGSFSKNVSSPVQLFTRMQMDPHNPAVTVFCSEPVEFYAIDARIDYSGSQLEPVALSLASPVKNVYSDWNAVDGTMFISIACTSRSTCSDTVFSIIFKDRKSGSTPLQNAVRLAELDFDEGAVAVDIARGDAAPVSFRLSQNYPNPFNQGTVIQVSLPELPESGDKTLKLEIYNILGQRVKVLVNKKMDAGYYSLKWSGDSDSKQILASGIYLIRVQYGKFRDLKKMLMVR